MEVYKYQNNPSKVIDFIQQKNEKDKRMSRIENKEILDNQDVLNEVMSQLQSCCELINDLKARNNLNNPCIKSNKEATIDNINEVEQLHKEMIKMKAKLKYSIPGITVAYMIGSSMSLAAFITIFALYIFKGTYVVHPIICLTSIVGSLGLLLTSYYSIKDWKEFIDNE